MTPLPTHLLKALRRSRLAGLAAETLPGRLARQAVRSPEYGVLYVGIAFWVIAGTVGLGRPLLTLLARHV